jgi:hypothetical protein
MIPSSFPPPQAPITSGSASVDPGARSANLANNATKFEGAMALQLVESVMPPSSGEAGGQINTYA